MVMRFLSIAKKGSHKENTVGQTADGQTGYGANPGLTVRGLTDVFLNHLLAK